MRRVLRLLDDGRLAKIAGLDVAQELGVPHQVHERLPPIGGEVQAELFLRTCVRPLDSVRSVQQNDAVRECLGRLAEALDDVLQIALHRLAHPGSTMQHGERLGPDAAAFRYPRLQRTRRPVGRELKLVEMESDDCGRTDPERGQSPPRAEDRPHQ